MNKLRKGMEVIVVAGKDKGKTGVVLAMLDDGERILVENINFAKKHVKQNPNTGEHGGVIQKAMPLHRSNVMAYDRIKQKRSRVGIRILEDGQRVRFLKSSDQLVEIKE